MKVLAVLFLGICAVAVAYLALGEYHRQQAAADIAERFSDPDGYLAKQWADRAGLRCDTATEVQTTPNPNGTQRPFKFTCWRRGSRTLVEEVACSPEGFDAPSGQRTREGFYKPISAVCWSVSEQ